MDHFIYTPQLTPWGPRRYPLRTFKNLGQINRPCEKFRQPEHLIVEDPVIWDRPKVPEGI
jgi:hypothetical protein